MEPELENIKINFKHTITLVEIYMIVMEALLKNLDKSSIEISKGTKTTKLEGLA